MNLRRVVVVALVLVAAFALQFQLYRANRWLDARLRPATHAVHAAHDGAGPHGPDRHSSDRHSADRHGPDRHGPRGRHR